MPRVEESLFIDHIYEEDRLKKLRGKHVLILIAGVVLVASVAAVGLWEYHEQPQFCGTFCHIMEPYVESWTDSHLLANAHAETGVTCLDCHEPTLEQQLDELIVYVKNDYKEPLKQREFDNEWCLRCHEHGSYEDIIERTKDYSVNGQQVNPHDPPMDMLANVGQEHFDCYSCHEMHGESATINFCFGCHMSSTFQSCTADGCHEAR